METKPLPEINWQNVRPPYDWWNFFQDADRHAFRFQATGFDMLNAWWLIEAATLAYSNAEFVRKTFARAGLPVVRLFDGKSTQCFAASNDDFIIVAFRGTETSLRSERPDFLDVVYDLLTDIRILLVPCEGGGSVHEGFQQGLDEVWWDRDQDGERSAGLKSYLDELSARKNRPIWITGHSLGAALATQAAQRYGAARALYSFGSPLVGDAEFRNRFRATYFRIVNNKDIVTRVPPEALGYRHVGDLISIDGKGRVTGSPVRQETGVDAFTANTVDIRISMESTKRGVPIGIPSSLLDHVPLFYSTHIWNNYVRST